MVINAPQFDTSGVAAARRISGCDGSPPRDDRRFSAGSNCAYLCCFTQSIRRRKMDHELQGNKPPA
ncbi:hypothetical protein ELI43_30245 (plasmid) [Rhizobium leguminosarum]|nr:hypothetical protein ELI43_30245 [Rhizobium leguminosarum]